METSEKNYTDDDETITDHHYLEEYNITNNSNTNEEYEIIKNEQNNLFKQNLIKSKKYSEIKVLGKGNFGTAILVKNNISGNIYVKKSISAHNREDLIDAINEVKALSKVSSQYVIKLNDYYLDSVLENEVSLNIITEYVEGQDLYTLIQKNLKEKIYFKETQILNWFSQICLGLKDIHDNKILHRDIKSKNIFMSKASYIAKIGDFGFAKILSHSLDQAVTTIGTPYYFSPEIINNSSYSFKSDVWSLGVLLFEMCMLKVPFQANSLNELTIKILEGKVPSISKKFSKEISSLIEGMLIVNEYKRMSLDDILNYPLIKSRVSKKKNGNEDLFDIDSVFYLCKDNINNRNSSINDSELECKKDYNNTCLNAKTNVNSNPNNKEIKENVGGINSSNSYTCGFYNQIKPKHTYEITKNNFDVNNKRAEYNHNTRYKHFNENDVKFDGKNNSNEMFFSLDTNEEQENNNSSNSTVYLKAGLNSLGFYYKKYNKIDKECNSNTKETNDIDKEIINNSLNFKQIKYTPLSKENDSNKSKNKYYLIKPS